MTADFARAIQEERRKLIKALFVARDKGHQAKVINRDLFVDGEKYNITNIPEELTQTGILLKVQ